MKKYTPVLFVFAFFITLLSFNVNTASASNCAPGDLFNSATGQACSEKDAVLVDCKSGDIFSSITGKPCEQKTPEPTTPVPVTPAPFPTIPSCPQFSVGTRGEAVKTFQKELNAIGAILKIDGSYGPMTRAIAERYCKRPNPFPTKPCPTGQIWNDSVCITPTTISTPYLLPNAKVGTYYQTTFTISGKSASQSADGYTWRVVDGSLPSGLWISTSSDIGPAITGTPTVAGTYSFVLNATNNLQTNTKRFNLTVDPTITLIPSIAILSPNGGETLIAGQNYTIRWNVSNFPSNATVYIELRLRSTAGNYYAPIKIASVSRMDESYIWQVPLNIVPDQYIIEVYQADRGGNIDPNGVAKDISDAPFNIMSAATPSEPYIQIAGLVGNKKDTLAISANIGDTFTIFGVPQNLERLKYWTGDGNPPAGYYNRAFFFDESFVKNNPCGNSDPIINGASWTMVCNAKGVGSGYFYIEIYANGKTYRSNKITVNVVNTAVPSITVTSPKGGESYKPGDNLVIAWNENVAPKNIKIAFGQGDPLPVVASLGTAGQNTLNFQIPANTPAGNNYFISVCDYGIFLPESGAQLCGSNRVPISITAPTPTPSITVLSPNGGEKLEIGKTYEIKWSSENIAKTNYIQVMLEKDGVYNSACSLFAPMDFSQTSVQWTVPSVWPCGGRYNLNEAYRIKIYIRESLSNGVILAQDNSDMPFTINARTSTTVDTKPTILGATSFKFTQFLEEGSYGNEVRELQKFLNNAGYNVGSVDGIFGAKVKEAVIKLQIANGLKSDGIVGFEVRNFLNK